MDRTQDFKQQIGILAEAFETLMKGQDRFEIEDEDRAKLLLALTSIQAVVAKWDGK